MQHMKTTDNRRHEHDIHATSHMPPTTIEKKSGVTHETSMPCVPSGVLRNEQKPVARRNKQHASVTARSRT